MARRLIPSFTLIKTHILPIDYRGHAQSGARLLWNAVGRLARPGCSDAYRGLRVSLEVVPMRDPPTVSLPPVAVCSRYIAGPGRWLKPGVMAGRQWVYGPWRA